MVPRQVIEDSDEDGGSLDTPGRMSPSNTAEMANTQMMLASSTDPTLFRAVYEEHLGQPPVDDDRYKFPQSPIFEDSIINQDMTSPSSAPSARKLKRSKTLNGSSSTSVSGPTLSNRKAKRARSMQEGEDLTQVTTPGKSRHTTQKDPWDVPTSSPSDKPADMSVRVARRNAERNDTLKTYGRPIRRTHTVAHTTHSQSNDRRLSSPLEDDVAQIASGKRSACGLDDEEPLPTLPKTKRRKTTPSEALHLPESVTRVLKNSVSKDVLSEPTDLLFINAKPLSVQVQRSTNGNPRVGINDLVMDRTQQRSPRPTTSQTTTDSAVKDSYPVKKSISEYENLTTDQKLQYDSVNVSSMVQIQPSSLPEMIEKAYPEDSNTKPNDTPLLELLSATGVPAHSKLLSPSPPISPMIRKMKRAKSEVGSKRVASSTTASSQNKIPKRKGRSKTIAQGEKLPRREGSLDELSLPSLEPARKIILKDASTRSGKKRTRDQGAEDHISNDELYSPGPTDLEGKQDTLGFNLRRSRSIPIEEPKDVLDIGLPKIEVTPEKSAKATYAPTRSIPAYVESPTETLVQVSIIQTDLAADASVSEKVDAENQACQIETAILEKTRDSQNTTETPAHISITETVSSVPVQPKKRGRPKKLDIVSTKAPDSPKHQSAGTMPETCTEPEVQWDVLCEIDTNKQPPQGLAGTPPTKDKPSSANNPPPHQTPTKVAKNGPDQHSPLQSGKVPYRVGLSKRTRIAPLLKVIRK